MLAQPPPPNEQPSFRLEAEAGYATSSVDVGSYKGTWHLRTGFGLACLALMWVAAWVVLPHALPSDSAKPSIHTPMVAFSPGMPFLSRQMPALNPRGFSVNPSSQSISTVWVPALHAVKTPAPYRPELYRSGVRISGVGLYLDPRISQPATSPTIEEDSTQQIQQRHGEEVSEKAHPTNSEPIEEDTSLGLDASDPVLPYKRTMYLMRGVAGFGKSAIAHAILRRHLSVNGIPGKKFDEIPSLSRAFIFSTQDFSNRIDEKTGVEHREHDSTMIKRTHERNREHCDVAMELGITPIIVDNSNAAAWEMRGYVDLAKIHGYDIVIKDAVALQQLSLKQIEERLAARKASTGKDMPLESVIRMLDRYEKLPADRDEAVALISKVPPMPDLHPRGSRTKSKDSKRPRVIAKPTKMPVVPFGVEKRFDGNSGPYSYAEFVLYYGPVTAPERWEEASKINVFLQQGRSGPDRSAIFDAPALPQKRHYSTLGLDESDPVHPYKRTMYLMRGVPGSGKSSMAHAVLRRHLIANDIAGEKFDDMASLSRAFILSSEDFLSRIDEETGDEQMDPEMEIHKIGVTRRRSSRSHELNRNHCYLSMALGITPIIVDNANTAAWEMRPFVELAKTHGYEIIIKDAVALQQERLALARKTSARTSNMQERQVLARKERISARLASTGKDVPGAFAERMLERYEKLPADRDAAVAVILQAEPPWPKARKGKSAETDPFKAFEAAIKSGEAKSALQATHQASTYPRLSGSRPAPADRDQLGGWFEDEYEMGAEWM